MVQYRLSFLWSTEGILKVLMKAKKESKCKKQRFHKQCTTWSIMMQL